MYLTKPATSFSSFAAWSTPVRTCAVAGVIPRSCETSEEASTPGFASTEMREAVAELEQLLRRRHVEDGEGRAAERVDVAVPGDADDLHREDARVDGDLRGVADREAVLARGVLVDHDLAVGRCPAAARQVHRVELRRPRIDADAHGRVAAAGDDLAVLVVELRRERAAAHVADHPSARATSGCARTVASRLAGIVAFPEFE